MCYTLEDIVDLVVVGMEYGEYKHKFSVFKDDIIPIDYFDNKQEKQNVIYNSKITIFLL